MTHVETLRNEIAMLLAPFTLAPIQAGCPMLRADWQLTRAARKTLNTFTALIVADKGIPAYATRIDLCLALPLPKHGTWTISVAGEIAAVGIRFPGFEDGLPAPLTVHRRHIAPGLLWCWWWEPVRRPVPPVVQVP